MNVKWDYQLKDGQFANPVLHVQKNIEGVKFSFNEDELLKVLMGKGHQLKTWGGAQSTSEPHWIGVKKQTPLHTDPRYPRYTWHLIVKVDNFALRGINKEEIKLENNMLILLDTHSPHQLYALDKTANYYLAVSMDSKTIMPKEVVLPKLIDYVNNTSLAENTERIVK